MKLKRFLKVAVLAAGIFLFTPHLADAASHTVVKGDTLYSLAKKYNTTVATLKNANNLKSNTIIIGQNLKLPGKTSAANTNKSNNKNTSSQSVVVNKKYKEYRMLATAYTANCRGCSGITASGFNLKKNPNAKVIAVDPRIIPLGTKVHVQGYGDAVAADTGGSIKGHKIDVFYSTKSKALNWGRRTVTVKVYES